MKGLLIEEKAYINICEKNCDNTISFPSKVKKD